MSVYQAPHLSTWREPTCSGLQMSPSTTFQWWNQLHMKTCAFQFLFFLIGVWLNVVLFTSRIVFVCCFSAFFNFEKLSASFFFYFTSIFNQNILISRWNDRLLTGEVCITFVCLNSAPVSLCLSCFSVQRPHFKIHPTTDVWDQIPLLLSFSFLLITI